MIDDEHLQAAFKHAVETHEPQFEKYFLARLFQFRFSYPPGSCVVELDVKPWMHNTRGTLHGGVIAMGLDISMGHLLNHELSPAATIETKIQFMAPAAGGTVRFVAEFLKSGKQIQYVQSRMLDERDSLLALATATWMIAQRNT